MARSRINFNSAAAAARLFRAFNKVTRSNQLKNEIGEFVVGRIRGEARRGRPLNTRRKFPPLKTMTKANRRYLSNFNRVDPVYQPNFSNLTFTGQLIDAVTFSKDDRGVTIFVDNTKRKPYKTGPNSSQKNPPTNQELDGFLRKIGFRLFTSQGVKAEIVIEQRIKQLVLRSLRRALGTGGRLENI